jgi:glycosyltransferase involved in cell wall biosynthesis
VTVFDGVSVGKHAVIGAGSVVNADVPDFAVAAGVPVRVIQERKGTSVAGESPIPPRPDEATTKPLHSTGSSAGSEGATTRLLHSTDPSPGSVARRGHSKRILYLSMYDPRVPYTGAGARGAQFVHFLAERFDTDLVYMTGSGHPGRPELEEKFKDRLRGVRETVEIPFSPRGYFLHSPAMLEAATRLLDRRSHGLVVCDYGLAGRYGLALSKRFGVPFVYASHNVEFRQYLGKARSDPRRWPLVPYVRRFEKKAVERCALLVAISDDDAAFFSKWTDPAKIVVVPQGFDPATHHPFYPPPVNDPKIILFFGNYAISTNREAVRAVRERIADEVLREFPGVKFRFVGANPPADLGHPAFEFPGFVESVVPEIRIADAVISPVLMGWGMPTKVVESLACGKPVVATEAGARAVPRRFRRLRVSSIDDFGRVLVGVLRENRPVDAGDFESLKDEFAWERRLERILPRIEQAMA